MPKTRTQETIFTVMMVLVMVYGMICYNIALANGGIEGFIFVAALGELPLMAAVGFILDTFIAGPLAKRGALAVVRPEKRKPVFMILAISVFSILFMCPLMSLAATLLFKGGLSDNTLSRWAETTLMNFPMAFFWQLVIAGPIVRGIFGRVFAER